MLQVRKIGGTAWYDMKDVDHLDHTGLFAIRGNSPEFQYNSISIQQPLGQFEYRFKPYPGNYFTRGGNLGKRVNLLTPTSDDANRTLTNIGFKVWLVSIISCLKYLDKANIIYPYFHQVLILL